MNYNFDQKTIIDKEIKVINSFDLELQTDYNSWSVIFECNDISCKLIRTPIPLDQLNNVNLEIPNVEIP